jgi:hypothetical protein
MRRWLLARRLRISPPVHARRDVDAGHETVDLRAGGEAFQSLLDLDRERVIVLLVADEHLEYVVSVGHRFLP